VQDMISLKKLIPIFIIISHISYGNTFKNTSQVSNLLFSNINEKKIEIDEISKTALSIEILLPKKIVLNELITFYENLGDLNKEKKIIESNIKSKGESLKLFSTLEKNKNKVVLNVTDGEELDSRESIINIFDTFKKILLRRFLNDYIKNIEDDISKVDRKQNRIIRNNPKKLEMNVGFFYKLYQKNEVKKVSLKSSLESLYEELEKIKNQYNSIK
tara:strand:+ start:3890 stop:4537 length:648 start_codon:yes stop_codon:yes gene_type:complete